VTAPDARFIAFLPGWIPCAGVMQARRTVINVSALWAPLEAAWERKGLPRIEPAGHALLRRLDRAPPATGRGRCGIQGQHDRLDPFCSSSQKRTLDEKVRFVTVAIVGRP